MRRLPAALAIIVLTPLAAAASGAPFFGYAIDGEGPGYPLSLPQTLRATVLVPLDREPAGPADTLAELYPVLAACWRTPDGLAGARGVSVTARLSLRRDGRLIGPPRITYAGGVGPRTRPVLVRAALDGLNRCLPARITPGLGGAIAGRPIALRLVLRQAAPERPT